MSVPTTLHGTHDGCGGTVIFRPATQSRALLDGATVVLSAVCRSCGMTVTTKWKLEPAGTASWVDEAMAYRRHQPEDEQLRARLREREQQRELALAAGDDGLPSLRRDLPPPVPIVHSRISASAAMPAAASQAIESDPEPELAQEVVEAAPEVRPVRRVADPLLDGYLARLGNRASAAREQLHRISSDLPRVLETPDERFRVPQLMSEPEVVGPPAPVADVPLVAAEPEPVPEPEVAPAPAAIAPPVVQAVPVPLEVVEPELTAVFEVALPDLAWEPQPELVAVEAPAPEPVAAVPVAVEGPELAHASLAPVPQLSRPVEPVLAAIETAAQSPTFHDDQVEPPHALVAEPEMPQVYGAAAVPAMAAPHPVEMAAVAPTDEDVFPPVPDVAVAVAPAAAGFWDGTAALPAAPQPVAQPQEFAQALEAFAATAPIAPDAPLMSQPMQAAPAPEPELTVPAHAQLAAGVDLAATVGSDRGFDWGTDAAASDQPAAAAATNPGRSWRAMTSSALSSSSNGRTTIGLPEVLVLVLLAAIAALALIKIVSTADIAALPAQTTKPNVPARSGATPTPNAPRASRPSSAPTAPGTRAASNPGTTVSGSGAPTATPSAAQPSTDLASAAQAAGA